MRLTANMCCESEMESKKDGDIKTGLAFSEEIDPNRHMRRSKKVSVGERSERGERDESED